MTASSATYAQTPPAQFSQKPNRIDSTFKKLEQLGQKAFVSFVTCGDPDLETTAEILRSLPDSGVDIIELGCPFSDPMADGPVIQAANMRALANGVNLQQILQLVIDFRATNQETPIVLMGYYNPIYIYGTEKFVADAQKAGVDGLIIVDLPPEEDQEITPHLNVAGLHLIRLVTPTTDDNRLKTILRGAGGFLYYVSVTGITGNKSADIDKLDKRLPALKAQTSLPVLVGFGITEAAQVKRINTLSDGVVVGSAIVAQINHAAVQHKGDKQKIAAAVKSFIRELKG